MTLSDKLNEADNNKKDNGFYWEKDVKEFIKELKEEFKNSPWTEIRKLIFQKINKLAGDKLI